MRADCYLEGMAAMLDSHGINRFIPWELAAVGATHPSGARLMPPHSRLWKNIIPTARIAQDARNYFHRPMTVNTRVGAGLFGRGYRNPTYNTAVGSGSGSQHLLFSAMDVHITGISVEALHQFFLQHPKAARMGIGRYNTFVHIDTRGHTARWRG